MIPDQDARRAGCRRAFFYGCRERPDFSSFASLRAERFTLGCRRLAARAPLARFRNDFNLSIRSAGFCRKGPDSSAGSALFLRPLYSAPFTLRRTPRARAQKGRGFADMLAPLPSSGYVAIGTPLRRASIVSERALSPRV